MRFLSYLVIGLMLGCSQATAPNQERPALRYVWVEQNVQAFNGSVPPSTRDLLLDAGIVPQQIVIDELPRCMGPGCPTYSALHFALIATRDFERALELGFRESKGPS